jgi:Protein of unknown function (DUF3667)
MSVDIEAGGALATAGLAANAIDDPGVPSAEGRGGNCANCNSPLVGTYCHACGQKAHVHRSILHMLEEGLHGLLHFDSKSWRTLPLLIARPGVLTRRYIDGQRVRYVSPLALFLFMIFLMFFVVSSVSDSAPIVNTATPEQRRDARAELVAEIQAANAQITQAATRVATAADEEERRDAASELEAARIEQRTASAVLSLFDKTQGAKDSAQPTLVTAEELRALTGWDLGATSPTIAAVLKNLKENPELVIYKLKNTAYKFAFMLIPISLPFLWLMFFWRRNVAAYDHVVFSMYSLSFMSLLFILMALMSTSDFTAQYMSYLLLIPPVHMFVQLRETYSLGVFPALWRTIALLVSASTVFVLFLVLIAAISFA